MKRIVGDFEVADVVRLNSAHSILRLQMTERIDIRPGQFAEVRVEGSSRTFLRRPISIHDYDEAGGTVDLLVQACGDGTRRLLCMHKGESLNVLLPLGKGFTLPEKDERLLLVGGGVGVAPLYFLGHWMRKRGQKPSFLIGARSAGVLLRVDDFGRMGATYITTEDGSAGTRGFVTDHPIMGDKFTRWVVCGPESMMKAVGRRACEEGVECEVSLENRMACGLGACLCCVEKTKEGNRRVCTEGPVFNVKELLWHG